MSSVFDLISDIVESPDRTREATKAALSAGDRGDKGDNPCRCWDGAEATRGRQGATTGDFQMTEGEMSPPVAPLSPGAQAAPLLGESPLSPLSPALVLSPAEIEASREAIDERAAIREFDGGEDRTTAEREARSAMRVFHFRLADRPDIWLTMLAPGCDLDDARRTLSLRFGEDRLIEVAERTEPVNHP